MVKKCCVFNCPSDSGSVSGGVTFHNIPSNEKIRQKWLSCVDIRETVTRTSLVCSLHFGTLSFFSTAFGRRLKRSAIPSAHPQLPDSSMVQHPPGSPMADASDTSEPPPEEYSEPEPLSMLEIKQEVPWEGQQSCSTMEDSTREVGAPPEPMKVENPVGAVLEQLRGELGALARGEELSAGLERLQGEIRQLARGDEFDAFGRYVAALLRGMRPERARRAQPLVINLLTAEMIKHEDDDT